MDNTKVAKTVATAAKVLTVFDFMQQQKELISKALPQSITVDRLVSMFTMVIRSNPELLSCTQSSLIGAMVQTAQLGLMPGNIAHCYYVPFNNKNGRDVQFIIGYKGLIELVNRSGKATILSTECVYEHDEFEYELGLNPVLMHRPAEGKDRGQVKGVYAIAKNLIADEKVFVYLPRMDIDKVRSASKAGASDYSPWARWYEEMAKKTAVKRLTKLLPLSIDVQKQIATDETVKTKIEPDMTAVPDETKWEEGEIVKEPPTAAPVGQAKEQQPPAKPVTQPSAPQPKEKENPAPAAEFHTRLKAHLATLDSKAQGEISKRLFDEYTVWVVDDLNATQAAELCKSLGV